MKQYSPLPSKVFTLLLLTLITWITADQTMVKITGEIQGNFGCMPSNFISETTANNIPLDDKKLVLSSTPFGCNVNNTDITYPDNSVVLIMRGECSFYTKVEIFLKFY